MSGLIEQTARAMCIANHGDPDEDMPNDGPRWKYWVPNARAAIAAVAEWIAETEERECYPLETLRAELERLRGEK